MIVKIIPPRQAGSGRHLAVYVLDLKKVNAHERLGEYALDTKSDGEKVLWPRTVNTGVDHPRFAVAAIEQYNAQNLRAHRVSRWEHIVVSFPDGERPTKKQMEIIEDRLMASIGWADHPRLSACHIDRHHFHLHIAVSRIDPETLKAEHP